MINRVLLLLAALALPAATSPKKDDLAEAIKGRVAGKPVNCINPHDVESTQIIPGRAIVYTAFGTKYVNQPLQGGEHLRWDDVLVQRIEGSQLCRIDSVTLLDPVTRFERNFIILGDFTPYTKPR